MNNRKKGYLLLELLLSFSLGAILIFVIYKTYNSINKIVRYIDTTNTCELEKNFMMYHLEQDVFLGYVPSTIYELYEKNRNKHSAVFSLKEENLNNQEEKLEKQYKKYAVFIPSLLNKNGDTSIEWVTTRVLFSNERFVKICYMFKKTGEFFLEKPIYQLLRREDVLDSNFNVIKEGKSYSLIEKAIDVEVLFLYPLIKKNDQSVNKILSDKGEKNDFLKWVQDPQYKAVSFYDSSSEKITKLLEQCCFPSTIAIQYSLLSKDNKILLTNAYISYPYSYYALTKYIN